MGDAGPPGPPGPRGPAGSPILPTVSVHPIAQRFFFILPHDIGLSEEHIIPAIKFKNDEGEQVNVFPDCNENGYFNLFINAVLQESLLYKISPHALAITATGQKILAGTPIILESIHLIVKVS
jgi:hypothetical protein